MWFMQDLLALSQESAKVFLQTLFRSPTVLKVRFSLDALMQNPHLDHVATVCQEMGGIR